MDSRKTRTEDCTLQMSHMEAVRNALGYTQYSPIKSDSDALALAIHAALESDGLVSVDEHEAGKDSGVSGPVRSTPLPPGWNSSQDVYTFHYRLEGSPALVVVKSLVMEETMLVHAASDKGDDMHTLELRSGFSGPEVVNLLDIRHNLNAHALTVLFTARLNGTSFSPQQQD